MHVKTHKSLAVSRPSYLVLLVCRQEKHPELSDDLLT